MLRSSRWGSRGIVKMSQGMADQLVPDALQHHTAGRLVEAEQIYRQVLATVPEHFEALRLLGVIASQTDRSDLALDLLTHALRLKPDSAEALINLGVALRMKGRLEEAVVAYHRAIEINPQRAEVHHN